MCYPHGPKIFLSANSQAEGLPRWSSGLSRQMETERERKRPGFETACIQFIFQFQETNRLRYKASRIDVIDIYGCIAKCEVGEMVEHARRNEERIFMI